MRKVKSLKFRVFTTSVVLSVFLLFILSSRPIKAYSPRNCAPSPLGNCNDPWSTDNTNCNDQSTENTIPNPLHSKLKTKKYYLTSCRPILSVIILVINKSDSHFAVVRLCYSLVWLQTELDSTRSYYHYVQWDSNTKGILECPDFSLY